MPTLSRLAAASITDLTAPTPPAVQSLASGTTTASATWTHPGAPDGTTYTCAVRGTDGSTPTASGSGLGAWTWTVANGIAYAPTITASSGGQTSHSSALVNVAGDAAGWTDALDLDLTGLTTATLADEATTVVTRASGGAAVASVWVDLATNPGSVTAGATGLVLAGSGGSGSVSAVIDVEAAASLTIPRDTVNGVAVTIKMTSLGGWTGTGTAWQAGVCATQARPTTGTSNTVQGILTTTLQNRRLGVSGTYSSNWAAAEAIPTGAFYVTILVIGGTTTYAFYGTSEPSDADLTSLTGAVLHSGSNSTELVSAAAATRYGSGLFAAVSAQLEADVTWSGLKVRVRTV
jgi:hypothetical protein